MTACVSTNRSSQRLFLTFAALGAIACSDKGHDIDADDPTRLRNPDGKQTDGQLADRSNNGIIALDEQALRGTVDGDQIALEIPLRSVGKDSADGSLTVSLRGLDGKAVDQSKVSYSLMP